VRQPVSGANQGTDQETAVVELRIPAVPEWVGVARLAAAGIASRLDFSIEDLEDLKLAVAEACNCCIQNGGSGDVRIACELHADRIVIVVERAGVPGNEVAQPPPPAGDDADLGGLGVFLIRALMDDVTYVSDASGTKLTLIKFLGK
jgi:serine/threonine-protein kinase RsbW